MTEPIETVIESAINDGADKMRVAALYAQAIRPSISADFERMNKAIMEKWPGNGLNEVKGMAWEIFDALYGHERVIPESMKELFGE